MDIPKLEMNPRGMVLDGYLLTPPFFSIWNRWKHLRGRSLVIGIIGPRGSGKTTAAVRMLVLDYMLKGRKVWSDSLPIAVDLVAGDNIHPLRSIPIEAGFKFGDCYDGCVFMDEINEGDGDSYRSMSSNALELSYDLQELRKGNDGGLSKMDVIWTTQSEMFNMPRIRFQTDIIIKCSDLSLSKKKLGVGEFSRWEMWDYSGIISGKNVSEKLKEAPVVFTKPWWHTFRTGTKKREERRAVEAEVQAELYQLASKIASVVQEGNGKGIARNAIWAETKIWDKPRQKAITRLLAEQWGIFVDPHRSIFRASRDLVGIER